MNRKELGNWGERMAKKYLESKGMRILEENYRCPLGEIDLIGQDGQYLVFIEVKTRRSFIYGAPAEAIDRRKQTRYLQISSFYIKERRVRNTSYRFDIVEVRVGPGGDASFNHIANAFQGGSSGYYI